MQTLTYGFKKPQTGDKGSVFWSALEFDIQQLNDHTHNGTDSAKLTTSATTAQTTTVTAGSFANQGGGTYRATVTMPVGLSYDSCALVVKGSTDGHIYYLTVEKISTSQFYLYTNTNTTDFKVFYVS